MSYCVNCGVELNPSLKSCPLCNTPVINPSAPKTEDNASPYPDQRGQVESVRRKDWGILMSIVLSASSVGCALLNLFVFKGNLWSFAIIGICIILFVLMIPAFFYTKIPIYFSILFDGTAVGIYLYMLTYLTRSSEWLWKIAVPIVALVTALVEIFTLLVRVLPSSVIATALYFFAEAAILCLGIEFLIDVYREKPFEPSWSAVVLTICSIIVVALIALLSLRRMREAVRRRLHF